MTPNVPLGCRVERATAPGTVKVRLSGRIDEHFDPGALAEGCTGAVIVDLSDVHEITSYGVRRWVSGLELMSRTWLGFVNCRPALVTQFNSVRNFAQGGQLVSFFAPYLCTACGKYFESLIDLRRQHAQVAAFETPAEKCPDCKAPAELDDLPEGYFFFAAAQPVPAPPRAALRWVDGGGVAMRVDKEVEGDLTVLWLSGSLDRAPSFRRITAGLEGTVLVMAQELEPPSPEGLTRLGELLKLLGGEVFLARAPVPIAAGLAGDPALLGPARLLSVRVTFACDTCGAVSYRDLNRTTLHGFEAGAISMPPCPSCGKPLTPQNLAAAGPAGALMRPEPPPSAVTHHLEAHAHAPKVSEAEPVVGDLVPGRRFGKYEVKRKIGAGGMAEVFSATLLGDGGFERKVVLKRIIPLLARDTAFLAMLHDEARLAARVSHPNVVQVFDVGQQSGVHYIAMEYVHGWDLNAVLRLAERFEVSLPVPLAGAIVVQLCAGLHAAHAWVGDDGVPRPIIHRDVSPHNVLLSVDGLVKVTDFGVAKAADSVHNTPTETLKGKLSFMAPELFRNREHDVDARVDVFATGVVLFQCLTLRHPFRAPNDAAIMAAILASDGPSARELRPEISPELDAVVRRALANDAQARFQTARELGAALEQALLPLGPLPRPEDLAAFLKELTARLPTEGHLHQTRLTSSQLASPGLGNVPPTKTGSDGKS
ncbi:MAG: protein kinase [Archangiaceae bacterium]|nr:protein kinase [Archangiaceae bacterium]